MRKIYIAKSFDAPFASSNSKEVIEFYMNKRIGEDKTNNEKNEIYYPDEFYQVGNLIYIITELPYYDKSSMECDKLISLNIIDF